MATKTKKTVKKTEKTTAKSAAKKVSLPKFASVKDRLPAVNPTKLLIFFSVIAVVLLLYLLRDQYLVAMINNEPITRWSVLREAEQQKGKDVVSQLVEKTLILQEADRRGVTIGEQEIDAEIKKIEDNLKNYGQSLDTQLQTLGMTKESLRENIRVQKLVEKMISKDINVTDKEVEEYMTKNKELLPQDQDEKQLKDQVKQQIRQEKLAQKYQEFMSDLQKKANIQYFRTY